jgi:hypothetical protein
VPIFSITPARMTEPAVGASTCASGSQVWNGNSGTLIANASANARKNRARSVELRDGERRDAGLVIVLEDEIEDAEQHQQRAGDREEENLIAA